METAMIFTFYLLLCKYFLRREQLYMPEINLIWLWLVIFQGFPKHCLLFSNILTKIFTLVCKYLSKCLLLCKMAPLNLKNT